MIIYANLCKPYANLNGLSRVETQISVVSTVTATTTAVVALVAKTEGNAAAVLKVQHHTNIRAAMLKRQHQILTSSKSAMLKL